MAQSGILSGSLKRQNVTTQTIPSLAMYIQNFTQSSVFAVDNAGMFELSPIYEYWDTVNNRIFKKNDNIILTSRGFLNPIHVNEAHQRSYHDPKNPNQNHKIDSIVPNNMVYLMHKTHLPPQPDQPLLIPELNMVVFYSENEMNKKLELYGSNEELVDYYIRSITGIQNGVYRSICRSEGEPLYYVSNTTVCEIPVIDPASFDEYIKRFALNKDRLEKENVIFHRFVLDNRDGKPSTIHVDYEYIDRDVSHPRDPIISDNGSLIFLDRISAEEFVDQYGGDQSEYFIDIALEEGREFYEDRMNEMKERSKFRHLKLLEIVSYMGLSSILTSGSQLIVEKLSEAAENKTNERKQRKNQNAFKAAFDLVQGVSSGVSAFKGFFK